MPLKRDDERDDLFYADNLLAVHIGAREPRERESVVGDVARRVGARRVASEEDLIEEFGDGIPSLARVLEYVDILMVDRPEVAARAYIGHRRITASPIHALGFSWHSPMTATPPEPAPEGTSFYQVPAGDRNRVIAVVDTGVVEPAALPEWMSSSVVQGADDTDAIENDERASHGTFVTSLIRQIAPTHSISVAAAGQFGDDTDWNDEHIEPGPTTELHVADAIHRLIERHSEDGHAVEALNLSVGGPSLGNREMATVRSAIARWRETFPKTPIFAAAGNSTDPAKVYPAAFRFVRGVAAANRQGDQVVWDHGTEADPVPLERDWVDDVAPGSGLLGLSGVSRDDAIKWSGSSFATAVATASYVNGGPLQVREGLSYWPNRTMRYGDVPGLQFA